MANHVCVYVNRLPGLLFVRPKDNCVGLENNLPPVANCQIAARPKYD